MQARQQTQRESRNTRGGSRPWRWHCLVLATLVALTPLAYAQGEAPPPDPVAEAAVLLLDINSASAKELARVMRGVGRKKAERIVRFREEHGPFPSIDALVEVRGIGTKTVEKNRHKLRPIVVPEPEPNTPAR